MRSLMLAFVSTHRNASRAATIPHRLGVHGVQNSAGMLQRIIALMNAPERWSTGLGRFADVPLRSRVLEHIQAVSIERTFGVADLQHARPVGTDNRFAAID